VDQNLSTILEIEKDSAAFDGEDRLVIVRARNYASSTGLPDLVGGSAPSWYGHETIRDGPTAPLTS
jgi:hypothetical protein